MTATENIYSAMHKVYQSVGYVQKKGRNDAQKYRYAGEADLIEALRPAMVEAGIVFFCSGVRDVETREIKSTNKYGEEKTNIHCVGTYEFTFAHAASGSNITVMARGEGTDFMDKASYKAMTGALKYALRQTFVIETGDDPDQDAAPPPKQQRQVPRQQQREPWPEEHARPSSRQEPEKPAAGPAPTFTRSGPGKYSIMSAGGGILADSDRVSDLLPKLAEMHWTAGLAQANRSVVMEALDAAANAKKANPSNKKIAALHTQAQEVARTVLDLLGESDTVDEGEGMLEAPLDLEPA